MMRIWIFLAALGILASPVGIARAGTLTITGPEETVFDWSRQRCETWDIPDGSARAWRDAQGRTRFLSANERARIGTGPDLDRIAHDCPVVFAGGKSDDPGAYDDRSWLAAPWRDSRGRLTALVHVEYHGHRRAGQCEAGDYAACWWNTIVEIASPDGETFTDAPPHLVAALPFRYAPDQKRRTGYFNPSNIFAWNGYLYAFLFAEESLPQKRGACLIRRPETGGASDWRAWDGTDFTIRFADPYRDPPQDPAAHICAPVPGIHSTISSVVRQRSTGDFLAVTPATLRDTDGTRKAGIWWTTSADLVTWTRPKLLIALPLLWRRDCAVGQAYAYPSLLDPDSPDTNFDSVDNDFWLYLVRIHLGADCKAGPRRDVIRLPVSWLSTTAD